jgi:hypothetical protein
MGAKPKFSDLLIDPEYRIVFSDRGAEWVTDRYSMVRSDLFGRSIASRNAGTFGSQPLVKHLRRTVYGPKMDDLTPVSFTGITIAHHDSHAESVELVSISGDAYLTSGPYLPFNARVLNGIRAAVDDGSLYRYAYSHKKTLLFFQHRKGQAHPVRVAVLCAVRLSHGLQLAEVASS